MANIVQFIPKHNIETTKNLAEFIRLCREELTVFGNNLVWDDNYWSTAHITFGAYHSGREIARLANFISEKNLTPGRLDWKNPINRPIDSVRTGIKARQQREKKLPNENLLNILADIFASDPKVPRDIFTSSVCAMLLCAPSRISEILALPVDCEVWQTKKDGSKTYGWRFQPGKGGNPCIKWIPDAMVSIAQEAISQIRKLTDKARKIAKWYEDHLNLFYRHQNCPNATEEQSLTAKETALALGIPTEDKYYYRSELRRFGLSHRDGINTLVALNKWAITKLPKNFPWFDKERGIKFSEALFCLQAKQLRTDMPKSPIIIWRPSSNTLNEDLHSRETSLGYFAPSIFDRHGFNVHESEIEQVCVKGDRRIDRLKERHATVEKLRDKAAQEIKEGTAGADRWYEIHDLTEKRLRELIGIMENPNIQNGAIIKLRNENEFSPLRRAIETKTKKNQPEQPLIEDMQKLLGGGLG